jgi:L-ascorbate metabolism protein UlaG (beta-lactamase superfamily)
MRRALTALTAVLTLAAAAGAADKQQPTITWHGQSYFELVTGDGTRIVLDPHAIEQYGRNIVPKADLILMSHAHTDHTQVDVVGSPEEAKKTKQYNAVKDPKGDGNRQEWNVVDEKIKEVKFKSIESYHDDMAGMKRGKNGIWVIETDGLRIVHLGDLGQKELTEEQLKKIGAVDVLMIPVGGVYTINGSDAKDIITQIKPKRYIIPMHYGTKVFDSLLGLDEFLDEVKPTRIKKLDGNELAIDPSAEPPKEAIFAILNWQPKK